MNLCEEYLSARGITDETVKIHGLELDRFNAKRAKYRLGLNLAGKGITEIIWFPLVAPNGSIKSWIARPLPTIASRPKFLAPRGSNAAPFVPRSVYGLSHGKPVIITEGPLKALACVQAGFDAIGLNGVWGAARKNAQDLYVISADLHKVLDWRGRKVYAAFDADLNINPDVRQALIRLYFVLAAAGADLFQMSWDLSVGKGIDDFLVSRLRSNGQMPPKEVLKALVADAKPFVETIQRTPLDLGLISSELAKVYLPDLLRFQICKDLARQLGVPVEDLRGVGPSQPAANAPSYATDPEPWPAPVDGDQLLHDLSAVILRHVVLDHDCAAAAALGIVLTYLVDVVDTLPLLVILSPTKRCGKTRLLTVFQKLVRRAMSSVLVTPATIYRSIEKWHPTLLVDEADNLFKDSHGNDNAELRTVFNSGFTRDHASVPRCVGENMDVQQFSTWAPKVVALTGRLPDTVYDRSIPIKLRRRTKGETIKALRETTAKEWLEFRRKIFRFATDNATQIQNAKPLLPKGLNDRAEDAWSPLLAIAQVAGGDWPILAAKSAVALSKGGEDQQPTEIQVLASVKEVYEEKGATGPDDFLPSDEIVQELNANPEATWSDWRGGKGISHEKLAAILRRFEVKGVQRQINNKRARGYVFKDLKPVFDRYL